MRIERWYWLAGFCMLSLAIHIGIVSSSRTFANPLPAKPTQEIEVALQPAEPATPKPTPPAAIPQPPKKIVVTKQPEKRTPSITRAIKVPSPKMAVMAPVPIAKINPQPVAPTKISVPAIDPSGGLEKLKNEQPSLFGAPEKNKTNGAPNRIKVARNLQPEGGPSALPELPNGTGTRSLSPEINTDDIRYAGGGAGGRKVPKALASLGGGGGRSELSVENPLAKSLEPQDKPGLGPGTGGGAGLGSGGGAGQNRGKGIGTNPSGKVPLASLRKKDGPGIGDGVGSGLGARPSGTDRGVGAESQGTGALTYGLGQGRGRNMGPGTGSGNGSGTGAGTGPGMTRGVPFGDASGLLTGSPNGGGGKNGGPGGIGRGLLYGAKPGTSGGGIMNIVYALDSSGSMNDGNKIGKAKDALKKALLELKPSDKFDVLNFDARVKLFSPSMIPATPENIEKAIDYVQSIRLNHHTNVSAAMETALSLENITHIFLMSDGEPETGIRDFRQLRTFIKDRNVNHIKILTLALGLGENFIGIELLKGIAEDNDGQFAYINLAKP